MNLTTAATIESCSFDKQFNLRALHWWNHQSSSDGDGLNMDILKLNWKNEFLESAYDSLSLLRDEVKWVKTTIPP